MAEDMMNNKPKKAPRQKWEIHWSAKIPLKVLQAIWGAVKIAAGAFATVALIGCICVLVFVSLLGDYLQNDIAPMASVELPVTDQNSFVLYLDNDGKLKELQRIFPENNSEWVDFEDIPQNLINATIAIEDKRFYEHQGVDWITTVKACFFMFFGNGDRGGSTITQQLVKNATGENTYTVQRKVLEIFRAVDLESRYDKDEIMEQYLNRIYMGKRCYGVKTAAAKYFGKELEKLSIADCASLISITNNPSLYNPYRVNQDAGGMTGQQRNRERQLHVLEQMVEQGLITEAEYQTAIMQTMVFKDGIDLADTMVSCTSSGCDYRNTVSTLNVSGGKYYCPMCNSPIEVSESESQEVYSYYVDTVIEDVARALAEKDGVTEWTTAVKSMYTDRVESGGYYILACIDMNVQNAIDKIYKNLNEIPKARSGQQLQSGMIIIDNSTGDIVGMAGGVGDNKGHDDYNRAVDAPLQTGSSIKPLAIYAPAFMTGTISPATVMRDMPLNYNPGYGWPRNDDRVYRYSSTIYSGVRRSVNAVAANTLNTIGLGYSFDFAKYKFGLSGLMEKYTTSSGKQMTDIDFAPLAMGAQTRGVSVRDMASGFATFANSGVFRDGRTFTKVYDRDGNLVLDNTQASQEILNKKAVNYMNYCLFGAVYEGTGGNAQIYGQYVYGKTGTTSSNKDRWFCGFTKYYTAAVWTGYDQPEVIYFGGGNPAAILFNKVMSQIHVGRPAAFMHDLTQMSYITVCLDSGKLATEACLKDVRTHSAGLLRTESVYCYREHIPQAVCDKHVAVDYCIDGNGVANEYCKLFAEEQKADVQSRSLVKITQQDINDIAMAMYHGLDYPYWDEHYIYLVDAFGRDGNFKGLSGYANKNVVAPYVVCAKHTKADWEAYQKQQEEQKKEEEQNQNQNNG
jgi:penicillin-binding protein 1A